MRATPFGTLQKIFRLQKGLGPGVAPVEVMIADQVFVKVPCREAVVAGPIQGLDLLLPIQWHPFAGRLAQTAVQQPGLSAVLETLAPAAERPLAHTEQLRRLHLVELV